MGTPNIVTKEYMQDPQHFADAFNYYAFDGRQVVRAEKLSEADSTELIIIYSEDKKEFVEKFEDVSEDVLQFVSDYKVNLIVPKEIEDFIKFKTELGVALKYISVVDQKEEYKDVNKETAILLKEVAGINVKVKEGEEKVNMCKALQDITDEAIEKGHATGLVIVPQQVATIRNRAAAGRHHPQPRYSKQKSRLQRSRLSNLKLRNTSCIILPFFRG